MANNEDRFGDERLKKGSGEAVRGSREAADSARQHQDGGSLSSEERRRLLRAEWVQEVLPSVPEDPKFHFCWLSTTNSTDPIYKRIQRGYVPVKATEIPGQFGGQYTVQGGEYDGCVACNEMLLFKIPMEVYNDLMTIYHYDIPNEQEEAIYERVRNGAQDSSGRNLMEVEGGFEQLGRRVPNPTFS